MRETRHIMPLLQCCHSTLWAAIHNVKLPLNHTQLLHCSHTTRSAMLLSRAARDATTHLPTPSAYQCAQSTPHTHFGRQRDSRVRPTSRGGLGPASTHLTVLAGWAVLALKGVAGWRNHRHSRHYFFLLRRASCWWACPVECQ